MRPAPRMSTLNLDMVIFENDYEDRVDGTYTPSRGVKGGCTVTRTVKGMFKGADRSCDSTSSSQSHRGSILHTTGSIGAVTTTKLARAFSSATRQLKFRINAGSSPNPGHHAAPSHIL